MTRASVLTISLSLLSGCADDQSSLSLSGSLNDPSGAQSDAGTTTTAGGDPEEASSGSTDLPTGGDAPSPDIPVCNPQDDLEPNDGEDVAYMLNNIDDMDGSGSLVDSILAGAEDVDWLAYMGKDVALAFVDPAGMLETDMELRLCLFVECLIGFTAMPTCTDSIYEESPEGRVGCCNTGQDAFVSIDLTCTQGDGDDSALVLMRVDRGSTDVCVPYDLEYHF